MNHAYERQYISKCPKCKGKISISKSPNINPKTKQNFYYIQCHNCECTPVPSLFVSEEEAIMKLNYSQFHIDTCPICNHDETDRNIIEITDNLLTRYTVKCSKCGTRSQLAESPRIACANWNNQKFIFRCHDCQNGSYPYKETVNTEQKDNQDTTNSKIPKSSNPDSVISFIDGMIDFLDDLINNKKTYRINQNTNYPNNDSNNFQDFINQYFKDRHVHRLLYNSTKDDMTEAIKLLISAINVYGKTLNFSPAISLFEDNIFKAEYLVLENSDIALYLHQVAGDKTNNFLIYI